MKMRKIYGLLALAVLFMTACDLDKAKDIIDEFVPDMEATIDGAEWKADLPAAQLTDEGFIITGTGVNGQTIILTIRETTEGTYEVFQGKFLAVYKESHDDTTDDAYPAVTGSVTLSDVNSSQARISGTFSFTAARSFDDVLEVTNGSFEDIRYTESE